MLSAWIQETDDGPIIRVTVDHDEDTAALQAESPDGQVAAKLDLDGDDGRRLLRRFARDVLSLVGSEDA